MNLKIILAKERNNAGRIDIKKTFICVQKNLLKTKEVIFTNPSMNKAV